MLANRHLHAFEYTRHNNQQSCISRHSWTIRMFHQSTGIACPSSNGGPSSAPCSSNSHCTGHPPEIRCCNMSERRVRTNNELRRTCTACNRHVSPAIFVLVVVCRGCIDPTPTDSRSNYVRADHDLRSRWSLWTYPDLKSA